MKHPGWCWLDEEEITERRRALPGHQGNRMWVRGCGDRKQECDCYHYAGCFGCGQINLIAVLRKGFHIEMGHFTIISHEGHSIDSWQQDCSFSFHAWKFIALTVQQKLGEILIMFSFNTLDSQTLGRQPLWGEKVLDLINILWWKV